MSNFAITSTVKRPPKGRYQAIKDAILGERYELSLLFVGATRACALNREYRNKDYVPNVLSFPLDNAIGEIVIAPEVAKREAKKFDLTYEGYVEYLLIHGCLHLKGYDHGATMERLETRYKQRFSIT